jgi:hypothetical protein
VNVAHRDIESLVPGSSDLTVQQTKVKGRAKGGKDARRTNQRKNAFGDFNEIIPIFRQIIIYPPILLILSAFFNSSHIHHLLLSFSFIRSA